MYVVTFYSFKGGVGRTLAMMNCAAEFVQEGKKVLVVDFDLEAPGLDTFDLSLPKGRHFGVIDYVNRYLDEDVAPEVDEFIHKGDFGSSGTGEIWIMPAGDRRKNYHENFNSISWRNLYDQRDGFLLLANLKAQWQDTLSPDYVFIDSRTGHTDVSGICTRQLPNAVVVLFFPNKQNLLGLVPIIDRIRTEERNINLHFVASNVPDIDDEHGILGKNLKQFREKLNYRSPTTIHNYPSLPLLNQEVFTLSRPHSRLASEYQQLARTIQKLNPQDVNGALMYLQEVVSDFDQYGDQIDKSSHYSIIHQKEEYLNEILTFHSGNIKILDRLANYRESMGEYEEADQILDRIIEMSPESPKFALKKARIANRLGREEIAMHYAAMVSEFDQLTFNEIIQIIYLIRLHSTEKSDSRIQSIGSWPSVSNLDWRELIRLSHIFSREYESLKTSETLIRTALSKAEEADKSNCSHELILNLIGQGEFCDAVRLAYRYIDNFGIGQEIQFNLAMARWGLTGEPIIEDFSIVVEYEISRHEVNANYLQCLSLAHWVLGNENETRNRLNKARKEAKQSSLSTFSCWTYLHSSPKKFLMELEDQEKMIDGKSVIPRVLKNTRVWDDIEIWRAAVEAAMREHDEIGVDKMLEIYGGGKSTRWYIQFSGKLYDQKLIYRAAQKIRTGKSDPKLKAGTSIKNLKKLGYKTVEK